MMRHNTTKRILLACMLLYMFANASGQVTIGSGILPNQGSLLDLKQDGEESVNATKGLGMPRVVLSDLKKLKMGDDEIDDGLDDQYLKHTGLVVYNVSEQDVCDPENILHGLYVWTGNQWEHLSNNSNVYSFTDSRDNHSYLAGSFGEAGVWMLENLAYDPIRNPAVGYNNFTHDLLSRPYLARDKIYAYPSPYVTVSGSYVPDENPYPTWSKELGLLYNFTAALNTGDGGYPETPEAILELRQGQGQIDETSDKVRGICPQGWYLPSDREWNQLEKELYTNGHKYSTYTEAEVKGWTASEPWLIDWEVGDDAYMTWRPTKTSYSHDVVMSSPCNQNYPGKSLSPQQGGFAALLPGTGTGKSIGTYGRDSGWYTSSANSSGAAWGRGLMRRASMGIYRWGSNSSDTYFSVRCKKK